VLVEETIRYVGPTRVRFHHHVVRKLVGGADGFAFKDKQQAHSSVDVDELRKSLNSYLEITTAIGSRFQAPTGRSIWTSCG